MPSRRPAPPPPLLPPLGREGRLVVTVCCSLFFVLVGLRLHGLSISEWHDVIDGSEKREILLGTSRPLRADDWAVRLPLDLGQIAHDPPFPVVNHDIGIGQNMLLPLPVPVLSPVTLFRPAMWGFFLGGDVGLAWLWWLSALGLLVTAFLLFKVVSSGSTPISLLCALLLLVSPFFQHWCLNYAGAAAAALLMVLGLVAIVCARNPVVILLSGLVLGWSAGAFLLALYPAYQVPLAQVALLVATGLVWERRRSLDLRRHLTLRVVALVIGGGLLATSAWLLLSQAGDAFSALRNTIYPGARLSTGGGMPLWQTLAGNLLYLGQVDDFGPLLNICEASSFLLFFPAIALVLVLARLREGPRIDPLSLLLLGYCVLMVLFQVMGVPEVVARLTGLSLVATPRTVIGLGLADAILLVRFLSTRGKDPSLPVLLATGGVLAALLIACALPLHTTLDGTSLVLLIAAALGNGLVFSLLLGKKTALPALAGLVLVTAASTLWFNPLVQGGARYLRDNPLSTSIRTIDESRGGETTWFCFGGHFAANLFRIGGVKMVNGNHAIPQLALWRKLDPEGHASSVYNRYAQVEGMPLVQDEVTFRVIRNDLIVVGLRPDGEKIRSLGVTHVLIKSDDREKLRIFDRLHHLDSVGPYHLYALD